MHDGKPMRENDYWMTAIQQDKLRAQAERLRAQHAAQIAGEGSRALSRGLRWLATAAFAGSAAAIATLAERRARELARRELLGHSDRTLADMGFVRGLLEQGIGAWPWKADEGRVVKRTETRRIRTAVRELQAYSDTELAELGITRAGIEQAVRQGRPGIDAAMNPAGGDLGKAA